MTDIFASHRGLCQALARRFLRAGLERDDLEQVAALGLVKACRRYTALRGVTFTNYAWRTICGELLHYVRDHERSIRLPRAIWENERPQREMTERLTHVLGREATTREIAGALGVPQDTVALLHAGGIRMVSLTETDAQTIGSCDDTILLRDALTRVTHEERLMLVGVYVFGFNQTEIGAKLGYPQRRASRLHARAVANFAHLVGDVFA